MYAVVKQLLKFFPVVNYNKIPFEVTTLGNLMSVALDEYETYEVKNYEVR